MLGLIRQRSGVVVDATLTAGLLAYAEIDVWARPGVVPGSKIVASVGLAAMVLPLAVRRHWPLASCVISMTALAVESLAAGGAPEGGVVLLPVLLVLYTVAAFETLSRALLGAAAALAAVVVQSVQDPKLAGVGDIELVDGFFFGMIGTAVWLAGRYVRHRRGVEATLTDRADQLERDRADQAEMVAAERSRIARELHDVIAHTVSVMGIQAAAAAQVLETDPERARGSLDTIATTSRDAVEELRRVLAVLRDGTEKVDLAPQPDLGGLEELVASTRQSGEPVDLVITGHRRALPAGVELAAYRIIQEALTNVRKHAPGASVRVCIGYAPTSLTITVDDDGPGAMRPQGVGHGLIGMRERVSLYGGSLQARPRDDRGFSVQARLPLEGGRI